jgi:hypothetical protein
MQVQLAEDHRARRLELRDDLGVFLRNPGSEHRAGRGRAGAGGIDIVLERDGNSMQRAAKLAGAGLVIQLRRLLQRLGRHHGDVRIHLRIVDRDPGQQRLGQLRGRDGAVVNARRSLEQRQTRQFIVGGILHDGCRGYPSRPRSHGTKRSKCGAEHRRKIAS